MDVSEIQPKLLILKVSSWLARPNDANVYAARVGLELRNSFIHFLT